MVDFSPHKGKSQQDPRRRLCKGAPETTQHTVAGCKMQAGTDYTDMHNQEAKIVYRIICATYRLEITKFLW